MSFIIFIKCFIPSLLGSTLTQDYFSLFVLTKDNFSEVALDKNIC